MFLFNKKKEKTAADYIASREDAKERVLVWTELEAVVREAFDNALKREPDNEAVAIGAKDVEGNFQNMDHYAKVELFDLDVLNGAYPVSPEFTLHDLLAEKDSLDEVSMIYAAHAMGTAEYIEKDGVYKMTFHPTVGFCPNAISRYLLSEVAMARMELDDSGKKDTRIKAVVDFSDLKNDEPANKATDISQRAAFVTIAIPSITAILVIMDGLHAEIGFVNASDS